MPELSPERVRAQADAWVWFPATATLHEEPEALLVHYPEWAEHRLELPRFTPTDRSADGVAAALERLCVRARALGEPELVVWVKLGAPAALDDVVMARGGQLNESVDVLACDLTAGPPELDVPPEIDVRRVDGVEAMRDSYRVSVEVFGGRLPPASVLAADAEVALGTWARGEGGGMVAYADGEPVGTGGLTVAGAAGRLWSGSVRGSARGRGVYRALLAARLDHAVERGATMGLVKGRVATSGPILRRAGFEVFGQERSYLLRP